MERDGDDGGDDDRHPAIKSYRVRELVATPRSIQSPPSPSTLNARLTEPWGGRHSERRIRSNESSVSTARWEPAGTTASSARSPT